MGHEFWVQFLDPADPDHDSRWVCTVGADHMHSRVVLSLSHLHPSVIIRTMRPLDG